MQGFSSTLAAQAADAMKKLAARQVAQSEALALAGETANLADGAWAERLDKLRSHPAGRLVAYSAEPVAATFPEPAPLAGYTVVATDGSQVVPDRHDGFEGIGLIHTGLIRIAYGTGERARLEGTAEVFFDGDDEDSEPGSAGRLALRRLAAELEHLATLAETGATVALTDGSLIFWSLAKKGERDSPEERLAREALLSSLDRCKTAGVPVAGYVSGPGSRDVVNGLSEARKLSGEAPLADVGVTDAALFASLLKPGERSPIFTAEGLPMHCYPHILSEYREHWIAFYYLNVGAEIARVEVPAWVASDPSLVNLVHRICLDQARKGRGYPVALAEAHEQAIVREPMTTLLITHDDCLEHETGAYHPERPDRLRAVLKAMEQDDFRGLLRETRRGHRAPV